MISLLLVSFFALTASAQNVVISRDGRELARTKAKWFFAEVDADAAALVGRAVIPLTAGEQPVKVEGPGVFWKPNWVKPGKMQVGIGALKSEIQVTMADGRVENWTAVMSLEKSEVIEKGCKKLGLKVAPKKSSARAHFLGLQCVKKADRVILQASVPGEVEWDATSLFEVNGKGERWKVYEVSAATLLGDKNTLGEFSFRFEDDVFSYSLLQSRAKGVGENKPPPPPAKAFVQLRLNGGIGQLSSKTPALSGSGVGPLFGAEILTQKVFWNFRSTAEMNFVAPLSGSQYYDYSLGLGPAFAVGKESFFLAAFEYMGMGQDQDIGESTISLRHNNMGVALHARFLGARSGWSLTARYNGLGGDSTHMGVGFGYGSKFKNKETGWGLALRYQMQSAKSLTGTSNFGQMILAGQYQF